MGDPLCNESISCYNKKFLTAIDHIDYHPPQNRITKQEQREVYYMIYMDNIVLQPKC